MAVERIDSIINIPAVKEEYSKLLAFLQELDTTITEVSKKQIGNAKSADGFAQTDAAIRKLNQAVQDLAAAQEKVVTQQKVAKKTVDDYTASQAQLEAATRKRMALEASNNVLLAEEKILTQQRTAEIKNQIKEQNAQEGSIEQLRLALGRLQKEYDNLSAAERETDFGLRLKEQVKGTIDQLKQLEGETGRFQRNVGNYQGSAKLIVEALEKQQNKLNNVSSVYKRLGQEIETQKNIILGSAGNINGTNYKNAVGELKRLEGEYERTGEEVTQTRKVVEGFRRVADKPQFLSLAASAGDTTKELRFFVKQLNELEDAGLKNSDLYRQLQSRLAQLTDQLADTRAEVKALASDTRKFDLFAGAVTFAADAFQTAAGAAVLFGASEEDAAEATKTLVAIQSVANGVKGIANELTTKGTFANKIFSFSQTQIGIAFDTSASAAARFKAALITTGIGALIVGIGLLVANFTKIKDFFTGVNQETKLFAERQERLAGFNKQVTESVASESVQLKILKSKIEDTKLPMDVRISSVNQLRDLFPNYFKDLSDEQILNGQVGDSYDKVSESILKRAKATAAIKQLEDLSKKELDIEKEKLEFVKKQTTLYNNATQRTRTAGKGEETVVEETVGQVKQRLAEDYGVRLKAFDKRLSLVKEEQDFYINSIKFNTDETKKQIGEDESLKQKQLKEAEERLKNSKQLSEKGRQEAKARGEKEAQAEFEINKLRIGQLAEYQKKIVDDEGNNYLLRLSALQAFELSKADLINLEQTFELSKADLTPKQKILIEKQSEIKRLQLLEEGGVKRKQLLQKQLQEEAEELDKLKQSLLGQNDASKNNQVGSATERFNKTDLFNSDEKTNDLEALNDKLRQKKISVEKYEEQKAAIGAEYARREASNQVVLATEILDIYKSFGFDTLEAEKKLNEAKQKLYDEDSKNLKDKYKNDGVAQLTFLQKAQKAIATYQEISGKVSEILTTVFDIGFEQRTAQIETEKNQIEKKNASEIAAINVLPISEKEKADKIALINAEAQGKKEALERRQRQLDLERAKFQKLSNIASIIGNTAQGVTSALATYPPNVPLAVLIGVLGAVQLAKAIATPLPKFEKGTISAPEGFAIVGERGSELIVDPSGKARFTSETASIEYLKAGSKVIPHHELTSGIMPQLSSIIAQNNGGDIKAYSILINDTIATLGGKLSGVEKAITNKETVTINVSERGMSVLAQTGASWAEHITKVVRGKA